jgi:hypothetical protein
MDWHLQIKVNLQGYGQVRVTMSTPRTFHTSKDFREPTSRRYVKDGRWPEGQNGTQM